MNYKGAWGNPQALFVSKKCQKVAFRGCSLPPGLPHKNAFPQKKVIETFLKEEE